MRDMPARIRENAGLPPLGYVTPSPSRRRWEEDYSSDWVAFRARTEAAVAWHDGNEGSDTEGYVSDRVPAHAHAKV
jgi:hypothetical protein